MNASSALPKALSSTVIELSDVQRVLLQGYPGVVLLLAIDGRVLGCNRAGAARLGREPQASDDRNDATLVEPLSSDADEPAISRELALRSEAEHDWTVRHRDGSLQPLRLSIGALRDPRGDVIGLIGVEPWPRAGEEAVALFQHHDTLTGLPSRAMLADRAEMALQHAARLSKVVAVLLIEITGFDALCRAQGRDAGDDVLRGAASRLHFELRKTDTAVRLEGGQFVVLLVDLNRPDEAAQVAEKIGTALSAPINVAGSKVSLPARIGVAWSPAHGDQLLPLIRAAEEALASGQAKNGGVVNATVPALA